MLAHQETGLLWLWGQQGSHRLLALGSRVMLNKQTPLYDLPQRPESSGAAPSVFLLIFGCACTSLWKFREPVTCVKCPWEAAGLKCATFPLLR